MRNPIHPGLDELRTIRPGGGGSPKGTNYGYFAVGPLRIISGGSGDAWEHVSVSLADRTPTWEEMANVKDLFWREDETVLQFHPKESEYVNQHPYCLHLWKQRNKNHPLPPRELI